MTQIIIISNLWDLFHFFDLLLLKGLVLATAFFVLLLAGIATNQSFGSSSHPYILEWGNYGNIDGGQFFQLESLSVDDEGNIYVTDSGNARIQ